MLSTVFKATKSEMNYALDTKTMDSGNESVVRLRGLPFECTKEEIATFFLGKYTCIHINILLLLRPHFMCK